MKKPASVDPGGLDKKNPALGGVCYVSAVSDETWLKALGVLFAYLLVRFFVKPLARVIEAWFAGRRSRP